MFKGGFYERVNHDRQINIPVIARRERDIMYNSQSARFITHNHLDKSLQGGEGVHLFRQFRAIASLFMFYEKTRIKQRPIHRFTL